MKRIISASSLPVLALVLVLGLLCGKLLDRQPIQAAQSAVEWEYCAITGVAHVDKFPDRGWRAEVDYFQPDGIRKESGVLDTYEIGAIGKAVAKLGSDGWELVSPGARFTSTQGEMLYFKRPKK